MTKATQLASLGSVITTPEGSAPVYSCRAWVNFDGTGTVAIRASGNVSSITDNATGSYTVNLAAAMPDTNFCVTVGSSSTTSNSYWPSNYIYYPMNSSSAVRIHFGSATTGDVDNWMISVAIFR